MLYFKVNSNTYLKYDELNNASAIVLKKPLKELIDRLIKELPVTPTDEELLKWAKKNYPGLDSIEDQKKRIKELQAELEELNKIPLAK